MNITNGIPHHQESQGSKEDWQQEEPQQQEPQQQEPQQQEPQQPQINGFHR
jgi:hypothetical protein